MGQNNIGSVWSFETFDSLEIVRNFDPEYCLAIDDGSRTYVNGSRIYLLFVSNSHLLCRLPYYEDDISTKQYM